MKNQFVLKRTILLLLNLRPQTQPWTHFFIPFLHWPYFSTKRVKTSVENAEANWFSPQIKIIWTSSWVNIWVTVKDKNQEHWFIIKKTDIEWKEDLASRDVE
jgi:hypothetical protein